jgi:hypothetical protein
MSTSLKAINARISRAGIPLELVRGEGYHYFMLDRPMIQRDNTITQVCIDHIVMVCFTKHYSAREWVNQAGLAFIAIIDEIKTDWPTVSI